MNKETLKKIIDSSSTLLDLKWKLKKYIDSGDTSFLGKTLK